MKENGQRPEVGFDHKVAEVRMGIISNMMNGLLEMRSPEGSDKYEHGKMVYQTARLNAAVIGWNPNRAEDIARHTLEEEDAREAHRTADHRLAREEAHDREMALIKDTFPGQFDEWEDQAKQGDVPPRNDAGGFEMKRRGW